MGTGFIRGFNTPDGNLKDIRHMRSGLLSANKRANHEHISIHVPIGPEKMRGRHTIAGGMAMRACVLT
jgi:hypothetical protein